MVSAMITPAQSRAARALLDWGQDETAAHLKVSVVTLRNFERGATAPQRGTILLIQTGFESAGVEFIAENGGGPGVRLRKPVAESQ